jgi:hypothetical protein
MGGQAVGNLDADRTLGGDPVGVGRNVGAARFGCRSSLITVFTVLSRVLGRRMRLTLARCARRRPTRITRSRVVGPRGAKVRFL